jgi:glycosyltransferase involved in cell wall biosynthesis
MRISTIVRHHCGLSALDLLREALTSLAAQRDTDVQAVIALQNASPVVMDKIAEMVAEVFNTGILGHDSGLGDTVRRIAQHRIISVAIGEGQDGRTRLLNAALPFCDGRYLAFLDYDDVLYSDAYQVLLNTLERTDAAVAVGGANFGLVRIRNGRHETYKRRPFLLEKRGIIDLFHQNFIPIHTFVIDTARVLPDLLKFDERFTRAEDYVFLLRLALAHSFDFSNLTRPIAEYRLRDDGSNTSLHPWAEEKNNEKMPEWESQLAAIWELKSTLYATVSVQELSKYSQEVERLRQVERQLKLLKYYLAPAKYSYRTYRYLKGRFAMLFTKT